MMVNQRSSFAIFRSAVYALFLKEMYDSVGIQKIGYFWLFFEVLFIVLVFIALRTYLRGLDIPGLDIVVFLAINIMAFYFFRTTVQMLSGCFKGNKKLLEYKQVKPFDIVLSKFFFNLFIRILATFVLLLVGYYYDFDLAVKDINFVILAVVWLAIFSFGIGLLSAILAHFFDFYKRVIGYMMFPLLFTSAIFYTIESLPPTLRELLLYNPLVHFMELLHGSYFHVLDTRYVDFLYMTYWTVIPLFLGLYLYTRTEKGIIAS